MYPLVALNTDLREICGVLDSLNNNKASGEAKRLVRRLPRLP